MKRTRHSRKDWLIVFRRVTGVRVVLRDGIVAVAIAALMIREMCGSVVGSFIGRGPVMETNRV
jgi:hypothetical protein